MSEMAFRWRRPKHVAVIVAACLLSSCVLDIPDEPVDEPVIETVRLGEAQGTFVLGPMPASSVSASPAAHGAYELSDGRTLLLNVEPPRGATELLVSARIQDQSYLDLTLGHAGTSSGYFLVPLPPNGPDPGPLGPAAVYSLLVEVSETSLSQELIVEVVARGPLEVTASTEFRLEAPAFYDHLAECQRPVAEANDRIAGIWSRVDSSQHVGFPGQFFPARIAFWKTYFGGGVWVGGDLRLGYGVAVDPDGCEDEPLIILSDAHDDLVVTYRYELEGSLLRLTIARITEEYVRVGGPPIAPVPPGMVVVPYLTGLREAEAANVLASVGLTVGGRSEEASALLAEGGVIRHTPAGGTVVARDTAVHLVVADEASVRLRIERESTTVWANGHENSLCWVRALDAEGHGIPGRSVGLRSDTSGALVRPLVGVTDANGRARFEVSTTELDELVIIASESRAGDGPVDLLEGIQRRAVVMVQGINTKLGPGEPVPFVELRSLFSRLGFVHPIRDVPETLCDGEDSDDDGAVDDGCPLVLDYSYTGGSIDVVSGAWQPTPYDCLSTANELEDSIVGLESVLIVFSDANPNTRFIVLGHSQGGLLALQTLGLVIQPDPSVVVDAVITLDGALGGTPAFESTVADLLGCWGDPAKQQLVDLWNTTDRHDEQGSEALSFATLDGVRLTNAELVTRARGLGTTVVTFGSSDDCVFDPSRCNLPGQTNSSTQLVRTAAIHMLAHGANCPVACVGSSHSAVLVSPVVHDLIAQFVGQPTESP